MFIKNVYNFEAKNKKWINKNIEGVLEKLNWWIETIPCSVNSIFHKKTGVNFVINTDGSESGRGKLNGESPTERCWFVSDRKHHIN